MVQETVLDLPLVDSILERFAVEKPVKVLSLFDSGLVGGVGLYANPALCIRGKIHAFTLRLSHLPIQTKFTMESGLLVPDFAAASTGSTMFNMLWPVPDGMRLYLMVTVDAANLVAGDQYLVAYDGSGRSYRLPVSNCYEDGKLCSGKYDNYGGSLLECLIKAYKQFQSSQWNADLNDRGGASGMANSKALFRFKPLEKEGFESVYPDRDWTYYCNKIASEMVSSQIVLL